MTAFTTLQVTTLATSFATKLRQCAVDPSYSLQLAQLGFLVYWESLLSTHGKLTTSYPELVILGLIPSSCCSIYFLSKMM